MLQKAQVNWRKWQEFPSSLTHISQWDHHKFCLVKKKVTEVVRILEEEFINPFGIGYEHLCNLFSREEVAHDLASVILMYVKMVLEWKKN